MPSTQFPKMRSANNNTPEIEYNHYAHLIIRKDLDTLEMETQACPQQQQQQTRTRVSKTTKSPAVQRGILTTTAGKQKTTPKRVTFDNKTIVTPHTTTPMRQHRRETQQISPSEADEAFYLPSSQKASPKKHQREAVQIVPDNNNTDEAYYRFSSPTKKHRREAAQIAPDDYATDEAYYRSTSPNKHAWEATQIAPHTSDVFYQMRPTTTTNVYINRPQREATQIADDNSDDALKMRLSAWAHAQRVAQQTRATLQCY